MATTLRNTNTRTKRGFGLRNPYQNRFRKYIEKCEKTETSEKATYTGVGIKCGIFGLFILLGVALSKIFTSAGVLENLSHTFSMQSPAIVFFSVLAGFLVMLISGIIAGRGKMLTIIFGSLFCTSIGFSISNMAVFYPKYSNHISLALIITAGVFLALLVTFTSGLIKATDKFKSIVFTVFIGMIITSLLVLIASFIPATHNIADFIFSNSLFGIGFSVIYLIIACCYLIISFDSVKKIVEEGVHKDAEWVGAFSIVFSLIWIFLEVLSILNKVNK